MMPQSITALANETKDFLIALSPGPMSSIRCQFDDIAVGVAHENGSRAAHPGNLYAGRFERRLGGGDVFDRERDMRDAGMLLRHIHQNIGLLRFLRIQDEIEFEPRWMRHRRDRFGSRRSPRPFESQMFVEGARTRDIVHANADVRETGYL